MGKGCALMKLEPSDVLVDVNTSKDLFHRIKRWLLGTPFTHVRLFYGRKLPHSLGEPVFYESRDRGVMFTRARDFLGQRMVVMRLRPDYAGFKPIIHKAAWEIATDPQSAYDYWSIPGFLIPRLIFEKLGLPLPLKYQRNPYMVCSEAVAEAFWRAGLNVVSQEVEPLPGDFVAGSWLLVQVWQGKLSEEVVE